MLMKLPRWKAKDSKITTKLYRGSEDEMSYLSVYTGWTVPEIEALHGVEVDISKFFGGNKKCSKSNLEKKNTRCWVLLAFILLLLIASAFFLLSHFKIITVL